MRHRRKGRKLGRTAEHRTALMRNLATELFDKESIRTTVAKAKELRKFAERLITTARKDTLAARRRVLRHIHDEGVVHKLFDSLAPRYAERPGGYTRILRIGHRPSDKAEMAIIQLVEGESWQPESKERRKPRADDPNAPLEVKRAALNFGGAADEEEAEKAAEEETAADEASEEEPSEGGEEEDGDDEEK